MHAPSSTARARARRRHPGVQVAAVAIRGDRDDLRALVRRAAGASRSRYDRDGRWPTSTASRSARSVTYACPAGGSGARRVGELDGAELDRRLAALERAARGSRAGRERARPERSRRAGSTAELAPSSRSCGCSRCVAPAPGRAHAARAARAPARCCPTASAARGRSPCAASRSRRPTASSSATSAWTPTRAHAGRGGGDRPPDRTAASRSRGPLDDALLVALVETGVPVWALDAARLDGPLGLRGARAGERLGEGEYAADAGARARSSWPTPRARSPCSSATSRPAAPPARARARHAALRRRGRRGARASTSRRRCSRR